MENEIEKLEKQIKSMQEVYDNDTYTGKRSDLLCDITMKTIRLKELKGE